MASPLCLRPTSQASMASIASGDVAPPLPPKVQENGGQQLFSAIDSAKMEQIQATHSPDGREVDVKPILRLIESLFHHATTSIDGVLNGRHGAEASSEEKAYLVYFDDVLGELHYIIQKISFEISCKCSGGEDAPGRTTMAILNMLSAYSWDAKVVFALAAFGVNYGGFSLLIQLSSTNHFAKSMALLKQLPDMLKHSSSLKPRFDALNNLIIAMVEVTKCIIEFSGLPPQYISSETPPHSTAMTLIPTAAYRTIRSIVSWASQIASLIGSSNEYIPSTVEAQELSSLATKMRDEACQALVNLFEETHSDNMTILNRLIYAKDDIQPLVDGTTKSRVGLEVLRKKRVLLLISDLDIATGDIKLLGKCIDSRAWPRKWFEIVWLPIVDIDLKSAAGDTTHQQKFEELQSSMSWYTVLQPSILEPTVIKYIREVWYFSKRTIVVALDPRGKLVSPNALHMIRIWVSSAFPFTKEREEELWKDESLTLKRIVDESDDGTIKNWMTRGSYICLFGGTNLEWIRLFIAAANDVAEKAGIALEMVYVGKSDANGQVKTTAEAITSEKLGYYGKNPTFFWSFWARLESMFLSKLQMGKSIEIDPIMREIMEIRSYDGSDQGWAIFGHGAGPEMARANGNIVLESMVKFNEWKDEANKKGFTGALHDRLRLKVLETPHHCSRLVQPEIDEGIPGRVVCAECRLVMENLNIYRCCTD